MAKFDALKFCLFFFTLTFWLTGIALIVAGSLITSRYNSYKSLLDPDFYTAPILLIFTGCVITVVGFVGCCGTIREHYGSLIVFAVLLSLILVCEIAAAVAAFLLKGTLARRLDAAMCESQSWYPKSDGRDARERVAKALWDKMQQELKCCGTNQYSQWSKMNNSEFFGTENVPNSCCIERQKKDCNLHATTNHTENIYTRGCFEPVRDAAKSNAELIGGIGVAIAIFEVVGIVLASCMAAKIRRGYDVM